MSKKITIPILALGAALAFTPSLPAKTRVGFGLYFGSPAYTYPVPATPYYPGYPYHGYSYPYSYYAPRLVVPLWGGHDHHDRHDNHGFRNNGKQFQGGSRGSDHDHGRKR